MTGTVYRKARGESGVEVVFDSEIRSWAGWPADVVGVLETWNRRDGRLRFVYVGVFKCPACGRFVDASGSTAARLDHEVVCDDCVIVRVRRYGRLGRPETDLEKARRWQTSLQAKLARYRHNALTERAYVARIKLAAALFLDAFNAAYTTEEAILEAADPAETRALWKTVYDRAKALERAVRGQD